MLIEIAMIITAFPAFTHAGASFSQRARFRVRRRGAGARAGNEVTVALPGAPLPAAVSETVGVVPLPGRPGGATWVVKGVTWCVGVWIPPGRRWGDRSYRHLCYHGHFSQ